MGQKREKGNGVDDAPGLVFQLMTGGASSGPGFSFFLRYGAVNDIGEQLYRETVCLRIHGLQLLQCAKGAAAT
jgi:hypothetical protein